MFSQNVIFMIKVQGLTIEIPNRARVMLRNDLKGKFGHLRSENNIIKNYWYSRRRCLGSLDKIPSHDI